MSTHLALLFVVCIFDTSIHDLSLLQTYINVMGSELSKCWNYADTRAAQCLQVSVFLLLDSQNNLLSLLRRD